MKVTADDGHGNSVTEEVTITVSAPAIPTPAKPTGLTARPGSSQVSLSWDDPNDESVTGYQLRQRIKGERWGEWTSIQSSGAQTVSHTVSGLSNGKTYTYQIRAVNSTGAGEESKGVKATPNSVVRVTLAGRGVTEGDEGQTEMVLTVQISGSPCHEVRLQVAAAQGSATATGNERDFVPFTKISPSPPTPAARH